MSSLVALFQSGDAAATVQLRQGVVEAWNASTGDNTVRVAGGQLLNVAALTSESASLKVGDVVAILASEDRAMVLGKVTTPGDPGTVPTWETDIDALAPLTDLATVTTGTTVTGATLANGVVTGSLLRTAADGQRIEIDSPTAANRIQFFTDDDVLNDPGRLLVGFDGVGWYVEFVSPTVETGDIARINLGSIPGSSYMNIEAASIAIDASSRLDLDAPGVFVNGGQYGVNPQPVQVEEATTVTVTSPALTPTYAPGSPECGTTFTAPDSGNVYVTVGGRIQNDTAGNTTYLSFEIRQGAVIGSGTVVLAPNSGQRALAAGTPSSERAGSSRRKLVTGLTPGAAYNVRTMHAGQAATGGCTIFNRDLLIEPVL